MNTRFDAQTKGMVGLIMGFGMLSIIGSKIGVLDGT
jgi:hypothetical protein